MDGYDRPDYTISIAPRIVTGGRMKIGEASKTRRTQL